MREGKKRDLQAYRQTDTGRGIEGVEKREGGIERDQAAYYLRKRMMVQFDRLCCNVAMQNLTL